MGSDNLFKKRKTGLFLRKIGNKGKPRATILIVCEGEATEPFYFKGFRLTNVKIEGCGYNTVSLIRWAIELQRRAMREEERYDQVWCVFDRDSNTPENFNNALVMANARGFKVAYSNEAFELWYLLHFNFYDAAIERQDYYSKLTRLLGYRYEKNMQDMYDKLFDKQEQAIENAENLLSRYHISNPVDDNPSTTVHLLVQELNKFLP